jgi:hypothetical protein
MNDDRLKYRLRSTDSQTSVDTDTFIKLNLEGSSRLLPTNDINTVVSSTEVFNDERQSTTKYRILGTIKPIVSNVLFNLTGTDSWKTFDNLDFRQDPIEKINYSYFNNTNPPTLTFAQSYKKHLKEKDGWFGYYEPNYLLYTQCQYTYMEPKKSRFSLKDKARRNWDMTITYPFSADTTHDMIKDGLRIIDVFPTSIGGRDRIGFSTPVRHNLTQRSLVYLSGVTNLANDYYRVVRTGSDNGDNKEYVFSIGVDYNNTISPTPNSSMQRVLGGVQNGFKSKYYFRLFKKITTVNDGINNGIIENDDYEVYPAAFSQTVFNDEIFQFVFNEDIDVGKVVDNLGRPLSEIYLTIIKNRDYNPYIITPTPFFTPIQAGVDCGFVSGILNGVDIPDIRRMRDGSQAPIGTQTTIQYLSSPTPLTSGITINDSYFYGDVVEFNDFEQIEHVLGIVAHRFNTTNRIGQGVTTTGYTISGPRHEGYMYYPHHKMQIRQFSNYVESGDANTVGIPDYAINLGSTDGRWLWRDILDIGVNNGQETTLNYPFLNGAHYVYQNYCFPVRRQDPYGRYDLLYFGKTDFQVAPYDIIGLGVSDDFNVNESENAC